MSKDRKTVQRRTTLLLVVVVVVVVGVEWEFVGFVEWLGGFGTVRTVTLPPVERPVVMMFLDVLMRSIDRLEEVRQQ